MCFSKRVVIQPASSPDSPGQSQRLCWRFYIWFFFSIFFVIFWGLSVVPNLLPACSLIPYFCEARTFLSIYGQSRCWIKFKTTIMTHHYWWNQTNQWKTSVSFSFKAILFSFSSFTPQSKVDSEFQETDKKQVLMGFGRLSLSLTIIATVFAICYSGKFFKNVFG